MSLELNRDLEENFGLYFRSLFGANYGAGMNPPDAEDFSMSAIAKAVEKRPDPRQGKILNWLHTTSKRERIDKLSKKNLRNRYTYFSTEALDDEVSKQGLRPTEHEVERNEDIEMGINALKSLPIQQQQVYVLRTLGYEYTEIGKIIGVQNESTLRSYYLKATKGLAEFGKR